MKMTFDYKVAFFGLLTALVVAWAGYAEYRIQTFQTTPAVEWLFLETNIRNTEGQALTRAQMLDQVMQSALENTAAQQQPLPNEEE
jgi:hypothetical protein